MPRVNVVLEMEKDPYNAHGHETYGGETPPYDTDAQKIVESKGIRVGEAADMYGDLQTAEDYGYVTRG